MAEIDARLKELEKHLHMRGADIIAPSNPVVAAETSPHAWSRWLVGIGTLFGRGSISTCVEQIRATGACLWTNQKHLHMRGADPPCIGQALGSRRNISTCVEQILRKKSK